MANNNAVKLICNQSNDNSVILISSNTIQELSLSHGDTVLVRGRKKDTLLIVLASDSLENGAASANDIVRNNLRAKYGDIITIHPYLNVTWVRPLAEQMPDH